MISAILVFLLFIFGWQFLSLLNAKINKIEKIGLSFLLGSYLHSVGYFIIRIFLKLQINNLLLLFLGIIILFIVQKLIFKNRIIIKKDKKLQDKKEVSNIFTKSIKVAGIIILFVTLSYTFIQSAYWPPFQSDAIHLYDFRAKMLLANNIPEFLEPSYFVHAQNYPPFTSIMHFFLYETGSENPKIIYPLLLSSFLIAIYGLLKRNKIPGHLNIFIISMIMFTPVVWWNSFMANTNIIYMIYLSLAILYAVKSNNNSKVALLFLIASTWVRGEVFWLVPAIFLLFNLVKEKRFKFIIVGMIVFLSFTSIWPRAIDDRSADPITITISNINTLKKVTNKNNIFLSKESFVKSLDKTTQSITKGCSYVIYIFGATLLSFLITKKKITSLQLATLLLLFSLYTGSFIISLRLQPIMPDSIYRMSSILVPVLWVSIIDSVLVLTSWHNMFSKSQS